MSLHDIDRVFGRGRLKMLTGAHVEVFREAAARGESRRYTKRFLTTPEGDYAQWTEREWRILARLIGHGAQCVPDVVQYDRGAHGTKLVQTYDAGATVDQWATMLPVGRDGHVRAHVFEDCGHWWALAHHCLVALDEIHSLELVHLDVKGDNICIPVGPPHFDPAADGQRLFPVFRKLALIDFAFSLVSGETLTTALPIGWQQDYDYQSPRLLKALEAGRAGDLQPTEDLDWRCDMYSLAAMLKRYLPHEYRVHEPALACGWTVHRFEAAKSLVLRIREAHDREPSVRRPHADLVTETSAQLGASELVESLEAGWTLARDAQPLGAPATPLTPVTRLAPSLRIIVPAREPTVTVSVPIPEDERWRPRDSAPQRRSAVPLFAGAVVIAAILTALVLQPDAGAWFERGVRTVAEGSRAALAALRDMLARDAAPVADASSPDAKSEPAPAGQAATEDPAPQPARLPDGTATASSIASADPSALQPPSALSSSAQAAPADVSAAARIEAHRSKSLGRVARAAPPVMAPGKRVQASALPDAARRGPQNAKSKTTRPPAPASSVASRAPPSPVTQRASASSIAQAPRSSPVASVPTVAPAAERPVTPALVQATPALKDTTIGANAAASGPAVPAAPAQGVASVVVAPPQVTQESPATTARSLAPSAEPSRTASAPANPKPGPAPIVDASRPVGTPAIPAPRLAPAPPPVAEAARPSTTPLAETPRPSPLPSTAEAPRVRPPIAIDDDAEYLARARRLLADVVPALSQQVYVRVSRVLWIAAGAQHPAHEPAILAAAASVRNDRAHVAVDSSPAEGRRLHEAARQAYTVRSHVPEALDLALKAFGANPNDAEIAGHLAFLHLRIVPHHAERARQLALYTISLSNEPYPSTRSNDWTTFAVASALTGRSADARHAMYATAALTRDYDRVCRTALGALSVYGERLREPVEAMLYRLYRQGRADDATYCSWAFGRLAGNRLH